MLAVEGLIGSCGDVMALHEAFGKILASFQYGSGLAGTDNGNVSQFSIVLEIVVDALYQWVFGTNHYHLYAVSQYKNLDGIKVVSLHVYILAYCSCTGITRCDEQFLALLTLSDFPC